MYTLYLDTHENKIVLVIYKDNNILDKKEIEVFYNHSISTIPSLIDLLKDNKININEINEIIVCNGPGSFTGIRIGVTIAKTLSYTLNIPIKTISSLLIKAISLNHEEITIVEREKNGVFIASFDKDNNLIKDYEYLKNSEYEKIKNNDFREDIKIDYQRLIEFSKNIDNSLVHSVNPLYVKKIEVQK